MKLKPIREINTLDAYRSFKKVFTEAKADALATAMGKVQSDPMSAPQAIADLEQAGFPRAQAEEVVRQTIIGVTGKTPPASLIEHSAILPQSAAQA